MIGGVDMTHQTVVETNTGLEMIDADIRAAVARNALVDAT